MDPTALANLLTWLLPPIMIVQLPLTSGVCSFQSFVLVSNCRANSRLSSCSMVDKKVFSSSIVWGGREVAMFDHPRPTKAVLSLVNMDAGILSGMHTVAKLLF